MSRYFIDCEFDGHNGVLLSMAAARDDGYSLYLQTTETASDPWVLENVVPLLTAGTYADVRATVPLNEVGQRLRLFIRDESPTIIADSPVDIGRFCQAISTGPDGGWASSDYPKMTFEVHNVDCYPTEVEGAVQHNAWWDAWALRWKLLSPVSA